MSDYFCISVTFPGTRFHGRRDGGEPEWPPSPLRLLQAIVAANANDMDTDEELGRALSWLEKQEPPVIIAPRHRLEAPYCLSVPNNAMDIVAKAWVRGNYFGGNDANPATHRAMKTVRPIHMLDGDTVHFAWRFSESSTLPVSLAEKLTGAARRIVALGWGIDVAIGNGASLSSQQLRELSGEVWVPTTPTTPSVLRVPVEGSVTAFKERYAAFLRRICETGFMPVEPLTRFDIAGYRRATDQVANPHVTFEMRHDDDSFCAYSQRQLVHIAGMVRHLVKEAMAKSPPPDVGADWVEQYVVGHQANNNRQHQQFSYLPLPSVSIRHRYGDQLVRRVMIAAPIGHDAWLEHLARRLAGQCLKPERGDEFGDKGPPTLKRVYKDDGVYPYTAVAKTWASVTPVILPGHDDRKPAKTRKLIEKALAQARVEQPCEFEWSPYSHFPKSLSAHKYDKDKRPVGYIRPDHLLTQTAVHMRLRFANPVPGPLAIGAGRHCGLGLFAAMDQ